jgi:HEAT repeat protein
MMCAWALGRIGDTRATLALRDRLNDNKAIVRSRVILALEALGDRDAVPAIKPLLLDSEVSCEAATALASLAGRGAIPDLLAALEASLNFPKEAAGWAIGGILDAIVGLQDSSVIPHLFQLKEGLLPRVSGNVQYVDSLKDVARERIEEVLQKLRQPQ